MRRVIACLISLVAAPVLAGDGPAFDCTKASGTVEELICQDPGLARLDRLISERYSAALAAVRALDAGAEEAEALLRANQRGWIKGRNECWKAQDLRECVVVAYQRREVALVAQWILDTPTRVAWWQCGESPANEVVTYFFDTDQPGMRIERGDTIDTATLSPSGSGARYDASFGRYFWIKGDEALYREADPDGSELTCSLVRQD